MNPSLTNTSTDSLFLDANVLLEIILDRENQESAKRLIEQRDTDFYISALTAHLVIHFGQSIVELSVLRQFLGDYTVLSLEAADFEWAFANLRNKDFEDALQFAVAVRNGCNTFVSFDKLLVSTYQELPIIKVELLS